MIRLFLIFIGGGTGSVLRYALTGAAQRWTHTLFPLGTLTVNVIGCVLIGLAATLLTGPLLIREDYRWAILVGLLGGFTTFSTYAWESLSLAQGGQWWLAMVNLLASNGLGLAAVWLGTRLATTLYGT